MLSTFENAALEAGAAVLDIFRRGCAVARKGDDSPVTIADELAEEIILRHLSRDFPAIPVIGEESFAAGCIPQVGDAFFLVDPLDGTREFVDGLGEFTVNIAYIDKSVPVAGIVYAPALGVAFCGAGSYAEKLTIDEFFKIAGRQAITVRKCPEDMVALASRCHDSPQTEDFLRDNGISACTNS